MPPQQMSYEALNAMSTLPGSTLEALQGGARQKLDNRMRMLMAQTQAAQMERSAQMQALQMMAGLAQQNQQVEMAKERMGQEREDRLAAMQFQREMAQDQRNFQKEMFMLQQTPQRRGGGGGRRAAAMPQPGAQQEAPPDTAPQEAQLQAQLQAQAWDMVNQTGGDFAKVRDTLILEYNNTPEPWKRKAIANTINGLDDEYARLQASRPAEQPFTVQPPQSPRFDISAPPPPPSTFQTLRARPQSPLPGPDVRGIRGTRR